ncbi:phospholipid transport system substrate-binding protein [Roseovarius nanhaiticus]|uniref:Phospholipid transport system substrate-binding protein n=1 Tax=Roseovarius nanhaiticus TaxID=573024 RepID=A0A1N7F110_9RHOB|nr:ABC transporter substrate-binding protein [Roseovarius nanhaiticus]SEK63431.1 phospholipid transport system substrate-binding protein [Roseovarius nanhaiticus]SIR93964.1 phospholipid transport system substrate-binding protein [Roseovarius nanhaiticus]
MTNKFTRRGLIATGFGAAAFAALPQGALALTDAGARALVDKAVAEINRVIASGQPVSGMIRDFESIFRQYADVDLIARSTLGADANRASPAQLAAYTEAFRGYIARKYGKRFNEFVGGRIEVVGVKAVKSWHEVQARVDLRGEAPFDVRFLVSGRSGRDLFFDMVIEGISLRISERTEIGSMLDRRQGNIDALIADLRQAG